MRDYANMSDDELESWAGVGTPEERQAVSTIFSIRTRKYDMEEVTMANNDDLFKDFAPEDIHDSLTEEEQARGWAVRKHGDTMLALYQNGYSHCYLPANKDQLRNLAEIILQHNAGV